MNIYKHGMTLEEWHDKKNNVHQVLVDQALLPEDLLNPITYKHLCAKMKSPPTYGPDSNELRDLLDEIDEDEDALGHGMLTVFVYNGDLNRPGKGFFPAAKKLGYKVNEKDEADKADFVIKQMRRVSEEQRNLKSKSGDK